MSNSFRINMGVGDLGQLKNLNKELGTTAGLLRDIAWLKSVIGKQGPVSTGPSRGAGVRVTKQGGGPAGAGSSGGSGGAGVGGGGSPAGFGRNNPPPGGPVVGRKPPKIPQQQSTWQRFQNAMYSSRFGNQGLMPLLGKTLDVVGLGKLAGPVGVAITVIKAFADAIGAASARVNDFYSSKNFGGGTTGDTEASRYGKSAYDIDFDKIGANAQSDYYNGGPVGQAAREAGLEPPGFGRYRSPNRAKYGRRLVEELVRRGDVARLQDIGADNAIPFARGSQEERQRFIDELEKTAREGGDDNGRQGQEFNRWKGAADQYLDRLGRQVMGGVDAYLKNVNNPFVNMIGGLIGNNPLPGAVFGPGAVDKKDEQAKALDRNTEALERNTAALDFAKPGTYGGDVRTRGALPNGMRTYMLDELAAKEALALGAFE